MGTQTTRRKDSPGSIKYPPITIAPGARVGSGKRSSHPVKVRALLDPELYASELLSIGLAHTAAGRYQEALEALQFSLQFHIQLYGERHTAVIDNQLYLADVLRRLGKLTAARKTITETLRLARATKDGSLIRLGLVLNELAALELHFNNLAAAHGAATESKKLLEAAGDPRCSLPMDVLAQTYSARGQYEEARDIYLEIQKVDARTFLGTSHPRYIAHLHNYAVVLQALGDSAGAVKAFKKVTESLLELHGDYYPELGAVYANMGRLEQSRKKFDAAAVHFQAAVKLSKKVLGEDHPFYGYDLANLGRLALDRGKVKAGLEYLSRALSIYRKAFDQPHLYTASALTFIAYALIDLGKPDAARKAIDEAIDLWQRIGALCDQKAGDAGACDRAFAKVVREVALAGCNSGKGEAIALCPDDAETLHGKLHKGDIRRRLIDLLGKKGLIQKGKKRRSTEGATDTSSQQLST